MNEYTREEKHAVQILAHKIMHKFYTNGDRSGRLLYLFARCLSKLMCLYAYGFDDKYRFVVLTQGEYKELKRNSKDEDAEDDLSWVKEMSDNIKF